MPPNVLLVVLDSVRAANCSLYGHENETTPFLDAFQRESTVYTQARAPGTWSLPSHASIFTGYHVAEHRLTSRAASAKPGHTIWEHLLDEQGYETGVFSRNPFVTRSKYGLQRGFETIETSLPTRSYPFESAANPIEFREDPDSEQSEAREYLAHCVASGRPVRGLINGGVQKIERQYPAVLPGFLRPDRLNSGQIYVDEFLDWERDRTGHWAACINLIDAHDPYDPMPPNDEWGDDEVRALRDAIDDHRWDFYSGRRKWWQRRALEALYDGCIRQLDAVMEHLVSTLRERGTLDDTLLVITSDHGEGFAEPSRVRPDFKVVGHNGGIHEALLHVPLLVNAPGQADGRLVQEPASLTQFPEVVETAIQGNLGPQEFVPDGPIIASADHDDRYDHHVSSLDGYRSAIDMSLFEGEARAVYTSDGSRIVKQIEWGDDTAVVECINAQNTMRVGADVDGELASVFGDFGLVSIRDKPGSDESLDPDTYRHLRDLGYA